MKKVGLADINLKKMALPAGILTFSIFSAIAAGAGPGNPKTTVTKVGSSTSHTASATESPAPDASPEITINGVNIPTDSTGKREVTIPGGKAQVEVSQGQTNVTAKTSNTPGEAANVSSGNVKVHIDSSSTTENSANSSTSRSRINSSTNVFSTGESDVQISQ